MEMKICIKCKEEKLLTEYYYNITKNYYYNVCKKCNNKIISKPKLISIEKLKKYINEK